MAGLIPQSFINDLLDRLDIVEVIGARVTLKKAGKNHQALCPFHNEKSPSFSVAPDKQFYHCFGCGVSGTALTFVMEYERMGFVEAVETLAGSIGLTVPRESSSGQRTQDNKEIYELLAHAGRFYQGQLKSHNKAIEYLKGRGLTGEVARDFGIGYAPPGWDNLLEHCGGGAATFSKTQLQAAGLVIENDKGRVYDRFRDRVVFPIRDPRGRVIGFGGRVLSKDDQPKYLNSPETKVFQKGHELYGLYEARRAVRQLDRLLVVEGYMDVVALAQSGVPYAVATLGTSASTTHFQKMYRHTSEVVCCFDGDNAGRQAAWRALGSALPVLEDGRQLKFMFLPDGEDPDTLIRSQGQGVFLEQVSNAISAVEYLFAQLQLGLDLESLEGRARLDSLAQPHIAKVPPGVLQKLMQQRLSQLTGLQIAPASGSTSQATGPEQGAARGSGSASGQSAPSAKAAKRNPSPVRERLLRLLLQRPELLQTLTEPEQLALAELPEDDLLGEIVRHLLEFPGATTSEILATWLGEPNHAEVLQLVKRPVELSVPAAAGEFAEGVGKYIAYIDRLSHEQAAADLQADPTFEKLKRHQAMIGANPRAATVDPVRGDEGNKSAK